MREKRRIFAIGNFVNQRLLKPVHDWLMEVLKKNGFNQTRPLDRLVGEMTCFSFDLKSATDRWPLVILFEIMIYLFDRRFASSAVNSCLAMNRFQIPFVKGRYFGLSFNSLQVSRSDTIPLGPCLPCHTTLLVVKIGY